MSQTRIIALFNQSGGVAKTTLTQNLGYHLALKKRRVLLVDMDPQASLTTFMGLEPDELSISIQQTIVDNRPLPIYPQPIHSMALVPADINLAASEMQLSSAIAREYRLKNGLLAVQDNYDFILIDCPPSLGLLSIISLTAATHILVPIQCQFKSFKGTELLLNTITQVRSHTNPRLQFAGFVPTMFDGRTAQESRTLKAVQEQLSEIAPVYPPIPKTIAFADASERRVPLALFDKNHPAVGVLKKIADSIDKLELKL
ncbi:chromosome partitioning protein ParA [Nostoc sp. 'Peltigera membranacea cyanobiont' 213]|uniref:ParA family protein n=1 Tax=unclassified Nostoc TaxID=2593658 RepID=UPI000B952C28|nr:ParA family protein [Nostoc sp. 'Peltigera membranacea cyanobiont' 213]OYD86557.1 chromosome partitioning protein ParA [Nostoc sp. 'Peltigera membranacea cyanobiont' 213]